MQQLFFKFPLKPAYLSEDFFVSPANNNAFNYVNQWPNWNNGIYSKMLILHGELGSGKTHLAHIWQNLSNARILNQQDCYNLHSLVSNSALILEDISSMDEELLLHLVNFAHENQQYLLLTSDCSPQKLSFDLPDLRSRILAIPDISINAPDQELLKAVLLKHLYDRQLKINPAALEYIILRIDRSFSKLLQFIEELDQMSNISKRAVTVPLIKKALNIF